MTGLYVASNPTALSAQFGLIRSMGALSETLTRLSTGLKINSGKDDPAGLIASELLKAQITGTNKAITNTQRANALIATADSSLGQIGNLLNDIKGLTVEAAQTGTMTAEQIAANQLQVDAALDSIDRIARTTNYGGKKLLDGSLDFRTAGMSGGLGNVQISSANFGTASSIGVNVNVTRAADYARLVSNGTGVSTDTVFDVVGNRGSATISVGAGSTNSDIAAAINRSTDSTGVLAYVEGVAQRGNVTLSSTGSGNDILITSLTEGYDAGNYSFRITRGTENDVRIIQEAGPGQQGIVEISLVEGTEARYNDFAGLFNITVDTTGALPDGTYVTMTRGNANKVTYSETGKDPSTNVVGGRSITAAVTGTPSSSLNGWTVAVDNTIATAAGSEQVDLDTKVVYINSASAVTDINGALTNALAKTDPGILTGNPAVTITFNHDAVANPLQNGDRFTFSGGANAGEVSITYKEGATANDILAMLNKAPNVSASLASGVSGSSLIPMLPNGMTQATSASVTSSYTSGATSQEVIDLINSKLGDKFEAVMLTGEGGTGGRVNFMDGAAVWGDVNLGNALQFTGMDNGPLVRLTNLGTNGQPVANQKLSVQIIHPSEEDIKAGIHTPILEIKLATDAQGNSITTAQDIVNLFKTLTPEQTMGVSVSQLYPPGVDPNGRVYGVDSCGNPFVIETCPSPINGIVQPTGTPGPCGPQQGDLVILGTNQTLVADKAVARIAGSTPISTFTDNGDPAEPGEDDFTASGVVFTLTATTGGNVAINISFDELSDAIDTSTPGTVVIGVSDYNAATNGDTAANFVAYLGGKLAAAGLDGGFMVSATDTSSFAPGLTLTALGALSFTVPAGLAAVPATAGSGNAVSWNDTAATLTEGYTGTLLLDFGATSAVNGLTFGFTRDETREGFDPDSGTLMVYLGPQFTTAGSTAQAEALKMAINDAVAANWEAIRAKTGAVGDAVKVEGYQLGSAPGTRVLFDAAAVTLALADAATADAPNAAANAGKTKITGSYVETDAVYGERGVSASDPVMTIVAKQAGTEMAGITIHFINDTSSGLAQWNEIYLPDTGYAADAKLPELKVDFVTKEDGSRELIVTGNLGPAAASQMDAGLLAKALNANTTFQAYFTANALQLAPGDAPGSGMAGSVQFNTDITKPQGTTVGGYKIVSESINTGKAATSSGVGMYGATDSNERLVIESEELGSNASVSVNVFRGTLNMVDEYGYSSGYANGTDMVATVNGLRATTSGNQISINTPDLALSMNVANGIGSHGFTITGGGALLQLGPDVVSQQQMRLGIGSMLTTALGGQDGTLYLLRSGQAAALTSNDEGRKLADRIVMQAISNVANIRGRLGAIQKGSLEPNVAALQDSLVALTEANAMITNADFAVESSNLTRLQLLIQSGMQTLGIANQMPQYAASLIR